jgi:taurine transport system permease protein
MNERLRQARPAEEMYMVLRLRLRKCLGIGASALASVCSILILIVAWEVYARSGLTTQFLLPAPTVILRDILRQMADGSWFISVALTMYRALSGWVFAAIIGVPLGIMMARSHFVGWFVDPFISIGFPAPKIAFLPIFILWFGVYDTSKIVMITISAIFPIITAAWMGARSVDKLLLWSASSLGANRRELMREVVLPAAMPHILTGLQIALPMCLIVALVTEFLMGGNGLGGDMITAQRQADSVRVFSGIVSIDVLGFLLIKSLEFVRRKILAWHQEVNPANS